MNAGFDDKDSVGQRRDYAVAARKVAALRFGAERKFGNDGALRGNLLIKGKIFCRVNDVRAGSEHRHRRPFCSSAYMAPLCEAASMPRAMPETIRTPAPVRS